MTPAVQITLAMLAFGLPAFLATRMRLSAAHKGGTQTFSDFFLLMRAKTEAAKAQVNRMLLKMGWAWVLLCAPLIAYKAGIWIDLRMYAIALLGCILLGIILSGVAYSQMEDFKSVDVDTEDADARTVEALMEGMKHGELQEKDLERAFMAVRAVQHAEAQKKALEKARAPLRRSNGVIFLAVLITTAAVLLISLLAGWAAEMPAWGFWILAAVLAVVDLFSYFVTTFRG